MQRLIQILLLIVVSDFAFASDWQTAIDSIKKREGHLAVAFLDSAVKKGDGGAACNLGTIYHTANGVDRNIERARELYLIARGQGLKCGTFNLALLDLQFPNSTENHIANLAKAFSSTGRDKVPYAKNNLAVLYLKNPEGKKRARTRSARKDLEEVEDMLPLAKYNLGLVLIDSPSEKDKNVGLTHLQSALADGITQAELVVGYAFEKGLGTKPDFGKAAFHYEKAIAQGSVRAMTHLGVILANGGLGTQDDQRALALFEAAAKKGDPPAAVRAGVMYQLGRGTTKDLSKAKKFYQQAASLGHADARALLGKLE